MERDTKYEVLMACTKILFCTNIAYEKEKSYCLEHEECQIIINRIHENLSNFTIN